MTSSVAVSQISSSRPLQWFAPAYIFLFLLLFLLLHSDLLRIYVVYISTRWISQLIWLTKLWKLWTCDTSGTCC